MHRGYSLSKRYKEAREPLQDCGCEKDKGETAVVAILLLSPPLVRAVPLHNWWLATECKGVSTSAFLKILKVIEAWGPRSSPCCSPHLDFQRRDEPGGDGADICLHRTNASHTENRAEKNFIGRSCWGVSLTAWKTKAEHTYNIPKRQW